MGYVWLHLLEEWQGWHRVEQLEHLTTNVSHLTNLVHTLQKERGYSTGFLASDGKQFQTELVVSRQETNASVQQLKQSILEHAPADTKDAVQRDDFMATLHLLDKLD